MSKSSAASRIQKAVADLPIRSFVEPRAFDEPRTAVDHTLSRLAASGELLRVRRGVYWKGPVTRFGMGAPRPWELAAWLGGPGSGPTGHSAARAFGLTTQVPSVVEVAVPSRPRRAPEGIRFVSRSSPARLLYRLSSDEVAAIEVMRAWPMYSEEPIGALSTALAEAVEEGRVRVSAVDAVVKAEPSQTARELWAVVAPEPVDA